MRFRTFTQPTTTSTTRRHSIFLHTQYFFSELKKFYALKWLPHKIIRYIESREVLNGEITPFDNVGQKKYLINKCLLCFLTNLPPFFSSRIALLLSWYKIYLKRHNPELQEKFGPEYHCHKVIHPEIFCFCR